MAASKRTVVIGILGTTLDAGVGPKRWERWRPTVSLCQHEDLLVDRLVLLHSAQSAALAKVVTEDIRSVSPETEVVSEPFELENPWELGEVYGALHDFARRYPFKPEQEQYLVHITTGTHIAQICMFLLVESRHLPARLIQTSPPKGRDKSSEGTFALIDLDLSKYDALAKRFAAERREGLSFLKSGIETRNKGFNRLIEKLEQVAIGSREPILLMGPTGSGKSQLAKRLYELKKARRQVSGELVEVNCATIRGDGAMSALFGHVKGAFTGAVEARPGLLKKAAGGLLFLDEIGELGLDEQAMLLRAIEEKAFYPVGSDKESRSEFLLLAGTNRDLGAEVEAGRFREDLLARIHLWTFRLPGLSERVEDIEPNLDYELENVGRAFNVRLTMTREARTAFLGFACSSKAVWRGNFRDFNACVRRMATLCHGGRIGVDEVEEELERLRAQWSRPAAPLAGPWSRARAGVAGAGEPLGAEAGGRLAELLGAEGLEKLDPFDRVQLEHVAQVCARASSLSDAGRQLFAVSRQEKSSVNDADRLRKYLARYGLEWRQLKA